MPSNSHSGHGEPGPADSLADWRRITLERQLPKPRFPSGVAVPSLVTFVCLMLIGVLCVWYLGEPRRVENSTAIAQSQRELVRGLARSLYAFTTEATDEFARVAEAYHANAANGVPAMLGSLAVGQSTSRWRGAAVVDQTTRRLIAAVGDGLPKTWTPGIASGITVTAAIAVDGNAMVVLSTLLSDGRELVAAANLYLRPIRLDPAGRQGVLIALGTGASALSQGIDVATTDRSATALVQQVAGAATAKDRAVSLIGERARPSSAWSEPIVSAAPVGPLDLAVISIVEAQPARAGARWQGLPAAAALLVVAGLVLVLVWWSLIRPLTNLLRHAKAAACGEVGPHQRLSRSAEVRRIAAALDRISFRAQGSGRSRPAKRGAVPSIVVVVSAALAIVAWCGAVMVGYGRGAETPPEQMVLDSQNGVDSLAAALRDVLLRGPRELTRIADHTRTHGLATLHNELDQLTDRDSRYRSLYALDSSGRETVRVGREPLRGLAVPTGAASVILDPTSDRVPLLFAYAPMPDGGVLVAEYDVRFLSAVLRRVDGTVRLVDSELRTIASTSGFVAFAELESGPMARVAAASFTARAKPLLARVGQVDALVLAASVTVARTGAPMRFAVVVSRSVVDFPLAGNAVRRGAWLVAFLGFCVALLFVGWHLFVIVIPLRQLGGMALRVADGDSTHAVAPVRHDEVGAIAICLEICRQAQLAGSERLAGAVRLRGSAADHTAVLQRVSAQPAATVGASAGAADRAGTAVLSPGTGR